MTAPQHQAQTSAHESIPVPLFSVWGADNSKPKDHRLKAANRGMDTEKELLFDAVGSTGWITLNRPKARNALTFGMYEGLAKICASPPAGLKALVITGSGDKAFAAGTDIAQFRDFKDAADALAYERRIDGVLTSIESCPVPLIAAMSGACTGGGAAIAAACDLRLASANLKFGFPIARTLGNCLSAASLARLAALIGAGRVRELIFTSRLMDADEAVSVGLVSRVLADRESLDASAAELAKVVSEQAPLTLRATKELQRRLAARTVQDDDIIAMCYTSRDFAEGVDAFLAGRRPRWNGD